MQYSRFDGFSSVEGLVDKAVSLGMPAVGITDHGTVAGTIVFLQACRKKGIKPILGCEAYLARDHKCHDSTCQIDKRKGNRHLNVIAKDAAGFQNLCTLSQISSLEGYYYDPRIDFELLSKYREGLIVTSACLSNVINWNLSIDRYNEARKAAAAFKDIFGEDFYLEIMYHGLDQEGRIAPLIQKISKELGVKVICTNDCHYLEKSDAEFQQILMCISSGKSVKDPRRLRFPYDEFYFKSQDEMYELFNHVPSYLTNTLEIAEKCDYSDIVFGRMLLPKFDIPNEFKSPLQYLRHLADEGLKREKLDKSPAHVNRLQQELADLELIWKTKGYDFATYFLIVEDIIKHARENSIAAGVRGSGYGSLLLKCLGLVEKIDPVHSGLIFERFLGFSDSYFICPDDFGLERV